MLRVTESVWQVANRQYELMTGNRTAQNVSSTRGDNCGQLLKEMRKVAGPPKSESKVVLGVLEVDRRHFEPSGSLAKLKFNTFSKSFMIS